MNMLIEIEARKDGEEVYFYDGYAEDLLVDQGATIALFIRKVRDIDTLVVYLSNDNELLELWELSTTPKTCILELVDIFSKINNRIKKSKKEMVSV